MAKNIGKVFEDNWKKSTPEHIFIYRPPDAAQSFGGGKNGLRFSSHSPCDYFMFDGKTMFALELKSVAGKSISFEKSKEDKGVIHHYQVESLKKFGEYNNIKSGFIIDFRGSENTYFLDIKNWECLIRSICEKKSFNEDELIKYGRPILIEKKKLKVNYRYDVEKTLNAIKSDNVC